MAFQRPCRLEHPSSGFYHGFYEPIRNCNAQLFELSSKILDFAGSKNMIVF